MPSDSFKSDFDLHKRDHEISEFYRFYKRSKVAKLLAEDIFNSYMEGWFEKRNQDGRFKDHTYINISHDKIYCQMIELKDILVSKQNTIKCLLNRAKLYDWTKFLDAKFDYNKDPNSDKIIDLLVTKIELNLEYNYNIEEMLHNIKLKESIDVPVMSEFNIRSDYDYIELLHHYKIPGLVLSSTIVNKFRNVMFCVLGEDKYVIYGLKIGKNGREVVKVPEYYIEVAYDNRNYILTDVIRRNVCLYDGVVREIGPDIVVKGFEKYVNLYHLEKKNLNDIEYFIGNIQSCLVSDITYTIENLHEIYIQLVTPLGVEPRNLRKFSKDIQEFVLDTSYKTTVNKTIIATRFKPGTLIKASTKKDNKIRYYYYHRDIPTELNKPKY